jgi:hypothetical protein
MAVDLQLSDDQAHELGTLLDGVLGDLSHEIAATDNAEYRLRLRERRDLLTAIRSGLEALSINQ